MVILCIKTHIDSFGVLNYDRIILTEGFRNMQSEFYKDFVAKAATARKNPNIEATALLN